MENFNKKTSQSRQERSLAVAITAVTSSVVGGLCGAYSADALNGAFTTYSADEVSQQVFDFSPEKWAEIGGGAGLVAGLVVYGALAASEAHRSRRGLVDVTTENAGR